MTFIPWSLSLETHIESIDSQHKGLVEKINLFFEKAKESGASQTDLLAIIHDLKEYSIVHFGHEEFYMHKLHYPEREMHLQEHQQFIEKVHLIEERLESGRLVVSIEIASFIKDWVKHHIRETDQQFCRLLKEKGVN